MSSIHRFALVAVAALICVPVASARTVYRCWRDGTISLATAPEPGSRCEPKHVDDDAARVPNLWGVNGTQSGVLYEREQDGVTV
jgi:hypothetical protein